MRSLSLLICSISACCYCIILYLSPTSPLSKDYINLDVTDSNFSWFTSWANLSWLRRTRLCPNGGALSLLLSPPVPHKLVCAMRPLFLYGVASLVLVQHSCTPTLFGSSSSSSSNLWCTDCKDASIWRDSGQPSLYFVQMSPKKWHTHLRTFPHYMVRASAYPWGTILRVPRLWRECSFTQKHWITSRRRRWFRNAPIRPSGTPNRWSVTHH